MKKILIISTGGTFSKVYNLLNGELEVDTTNQALKSLAKHWMVNFTIVNIIGKDSLYMTDDDRFIIAQMVKESEVERIIIIHGTDTIDRTAQYLAECHLNKKIILTGSMVPFSINPIEATANFSSAYGYISIVDKNGVYIGINGKIGSFKKIRKNRKKGFFEVKE